MLLLTNDKKIQKRNMNLNFIPETGSKIQYNLLENYCPLKQYFLPRSCSDLLSYSDQAIYFGLC